MKKKKSFKYNFKKYITNKLVSLIEYNMVFKNDNLIDNGILKIGEYSYGIPQIIDYGEKNVTVEIGKFCSIANEVKIFLGGNHKYLNISTFPLNHFLKNEPPPAYSNGSVKIENDVWIGFGATILSGIKIGNGAIIGANSFVVSDVPAYSVISGNPAKIIFYRFSEEKINKLENIKWWNWDIEKIKENMNLLNSTSINDFIEKYYNK